MQGGRKSKCGHLLQGHGQSIHISIEALCRIKADRGLLLDRLIQADTWKVTGVGNGVLGNDILSLSAGWLLPVYDCELNNICSCSLSVFIYASFE